METFGSALKDMWGTITYDEDAAPVKTYCHECGHETGEERVHAATCRCMGCNLDRQLSKAWGSPPDVAGKTITFRHIAPLTGG